MKTDNGILMMDTIHTLDAMPMMADVISGLAQRPEPSPDGTPWWHYAVKTPAGRRALQLIGCTVDVDTPWKSSSDGWRIQPWIERGKASSTLDNQFGNAVTRLREALGDPDAGVFFAEICTLDIKTVTYVRSRQTMIALNVDGTRAAIAS